VWKVVVHSLFKLKCDRIIIPFLKWFSHKNEFEQDYSSERFEYVLRNIIEKKSRKSTIQNKI